MCAWAAALGTLNRLSQHQGWSPPSPHMESAGAQQPPLAASPSLSRYVWSCSWKGIEYHGKEPLLDPNPGLVGPGARC